MLFLRVPAWIAAIYWTCLIGSLVFGGLYWILCAIWPPFSHHWVGVAVGLVLGVAIGWRLRKSGESLPNTATTERNSMAMTVTIVAIAMAALVASVLKQPYRPGAGTNTVAQEQTAITHTADTPGDVWINPASHKYFRHGSRWFGQTQRGEYMSEADAIRAGYTRARR